MTGYKRRNPDDWSLLTHMSAPAAQGPVGITPYRLGRPLPSNHGNATGRARRPRSQAGAVRPLWSWQSGAIPGNARLLTGIFRSLTPLPSRHGDATWRPWRHAVHWDRGRPGRQSVSVLYRRGKGVTTTDGRDARESPPGCARPPIVLQCPHTTLTARSPCTPKPCAPWSSPRSWTAWPSIPPFYHSRQGGRFRVAQEPTPIPYSLSAADVPGAGRGRGSAPSHTRSGKRRAGEE